MALITLLFTSLCWVERIFCYYCTFEETERLVCSRVKRCTHIYQVHTTALTTRTHPLSFTALFQMLRAKSTAIQELKRSLLTLFWTYHFEEEHISFDIELLLSCVGTVCWDNSSLQCIPVPSDLPSLGRPSGCLRVFDLNPTMNFQVTWTCILTNEGQ